MLSSWPLVIDYGLLLIDFGTAVIDLGATVINLGAAVIGFGGGRDRLRGEPIDGVVGLALP